MDDNLIQIPAFLNTYQNNQQQQNIECMASEYSRVTCNGSCMDNSECSGLLGAGCDCRQSGCESTCESICVSDQDPCVWCEGACEDSCNSGCERSCETAAQQCEDYCEHFYEGGCGSCEDSECSCQSSQGGGCGSCESCQGCQGTCQGYCESNDCQDFCESGYQNIGIYSQDTSGNINKTTNIRTNINSKTVPVMQVYANVNGETKLVYDFADEIVGIVIIPKTIYNYGTEAQEGWPKDYAITKEEWQASIYYNNKQFRLLNKTTSLGHGGGGIEGNICFKLADGTYINDSNIIDVLFLQHKFIFEIQSNQAGILNPVTWCGYEFTNNETIIYTKEIMKNLSFDLASKDAGSETCMITIKTVKLDGKDLEIEFKNNFPETSIYGIGTTWLITKDGGTKIYSASNVLLTNDAAQNRAWICPTSGLYSIELHGQGGNGGTGIANYNMHDPAFGSAHGDERMAGAGGGGGGSGVKYSSEILTQSKSYNITWTNGKTTFDNYYCNSGANGGNGYAPDPWGSYIFAEGGIGGAKATYASGGINLASDGETGDAEWYYANSGANGGAGGSGGSTRGSYGNGGKGADVPSENWGSSSAESQTYSGSIGQPGAIIITYLG